jgi:hypothetical protein
MEERNKKKQRRRSKKKQEEERRKKKRKREKWKGERERENHVLIAPRLNPAEAAAATSSGGVSLTWPLLTFAIAASTRLTKAAPSFGASQIMSKEPEIERKGNEKWNEVGRKEKWENGNWKKREVQRERQRGIKRVRGKWCREGRKEKKERRRMGKWFYHK